MSKLVITDYVVAWDINDDHGRIKVQREGNEDYREVPLTSHKEFQSLLVLLQGPKAIYYDTEQTIFATTRD